MPENILIQLLVVLSLFLAFLVVTVRHTVHAAAILAGFLISIAGIYLALLAEFVAVVQVLLYAGGVLILTVFCIFLVSSWTENVRPVPRLRKVLPAVAAALLGGGLVTQLLPLWEVNLPPLESTAVNFASPGRLGAMLVSAASDGIVVSFEVLSVLLLCALIAAVMLSRMYSRE